MAKKQKLQVRTNEIKEFHLFDKTFLARVDFVRKCGEYAQPRVFQRTDGEKLVRQAAKKGPNDKIIWDTYLWEQSWGVQPNVLSPEESRFWLTVLLHPFMGDIVDTEVIDLIIQATQVAELMSDMPRSMLIEGIGRRAQSNVLPLFRHLIQSPLMGWARLY